MMTQTMRKGPTSSMPSSSWKVRDKKRQVMVSSFLVKSIKSFPMRIEPLKGKHKWVILPGIQKLTWKKERIHPLDMTKTAFGKLSSRPPFLTGPWDEVYSPHSLCSYISLHHSSQLAWPHLPSKEGFLTTLLGHIHHRSPAPSLTSDLLPQQQVTPAAHAPGSSQLHKGCCTLCATIQFPSRN